MTVRAVEGKKPYRGGTAIQITEDKEINLLLRALNNLLKVNGNNELYCDLQLDDELEPTSDFPVGITTGRIIVDNGWDWNGTIVCAKTTSGDNIKLVYTDSGELYIDNGTGTFKRIYLNSVFAPDNQGQEGQVLTKTSNGYEWKDSSGGGQSATAITVTLTAEGWNDNEQTVTATGVTASNTVIVSPVSSDISDYTSAGIYCSAQGTDSLTFSCSTTPSGDIDVNVVILN